MSNGSSGSGSGPPADMAFVQYSRPPLESTTYTVTVTQEVSVQGQGATCSATQSFTVAGEQFTLGPTDVNTVYPPPGSQGDYSSVLAHVVLTSPTLPWERSPVTDPPAPAAGDPVPTWLAVFLFDEGDPPPAPQALTVASLTAPPPGTWCPPPVTQLASTTPLTAIDIPLATFSAIAPSLADLGWMAHVRSVDAAGKATAGGAPPAVEYAVVFGNRLPVPGNLATAHLVSLEGFGDYLPADDGTPSAQVPAGTTAVRVVTLQSWTFTAQGLPQDFAGLLTQASLDPPWVTLPYDRARATGHAGADAAVRNAFGMGYTALDHTLRDGSTTVSWYRGPLLPLGTPATAAPPWSDSDQLLRYDPQVGMFDVSYAAAWELGRLLALHDAAYAAALYRWKLTQTQAAVAALEEEIIDAQLPPVVLAELGTGTETDARHARLAAVVRGLVRPAAARLRHAHTGE